MLDASLPWSRNDLAAAVPASACCSACSAPTGLFVALLGLIPLATAVDADRRATPGKPRRDSAPSCRRRASRDSYRDVGLPMLLGGGAVRPVALLLELLGGLRHARRPPQRRRHQRRPADRPGRRPARRRQRLLVPATTCASTGPATGSSRCRPTIAERARPSSDEPRRPSSSTSGTRRSASCPTSRTPTTTPPSARSSRRCKDLVEQFREFGPQFHVEVLDVEEEGYERQAGPR